MGREPLRHAFERIEMALHRVLPRQQHRVVAPRHALRAHEARELDERLDAALDGGHARLDVGAVRRDGVVEVRVEAVGDLGEARQDGTVVLRAEHHAVDDGGIELVARHLVGEERVAHKDVALLEAAEQPVGVVLHRVGPRTGVDDHRDGPFPNGRTIG